MLMPLVSTKGVVGRQILLTPSTQLPYLNSFAPSAHPLQFPSGCTVEIIFISLFVLEGIVKIIGLGYKTYFESKFNWYVFPIDSHRFQCRGSKVTFFTIVVHWSFLVSRISASISSLC